jgi:hypothetical protein
MLGECQRLAPKNCHPVPATPSAIRINCMCVLCTGAHSMHRSRGPHAPVDGHARTHCQPDTIEDHPCHYTTMPRARMHIYAGARVQERAYVRARSHARMHASVCACMLDPVLALRALSRCKKNARYMRTGVPTRLRGLGSACDPTQNRVQIAPTAPAHPAPPRRQATTSSGARPPFCSFTFRTPPAPTRWDRGNHSATARPKCP